MFFFSFNVFISSAQFSLLSFTNILFAYDKCMLMLNAYAFQIFRLIVFFSIEAFKCELQLEICILFFNFIEKIVCLNVATRISKNIYHWNILFFLLSVSRSINNLIVWSYYTIFRIFRYKKRSVSRFKKSERVIFCLLLVSILAKHLAYDNM